MECLSASACLAFGSAGASTSVYSEPVVAVAPDSARAQRFAEILQTESQRESVYVAASGVAPSVPSNDNPLVSFMSQFQSLDFRSHASVDKYEPSGISAKSDSTASPNEDILQAQAGIVRTVLMMEVLNCAKQGVTTLFQQQG